MRIAIEAQRIFRENKHGMDFVILEILRKLQDEDKQNEYFVFVASGSDKCLSSSANMKIIELPAFVYPIWEQIVLPLYVNKYKADILHCTSNTAPILSKIPLILTLHDVIFMEKREYPNKSLYQNLGWYYRKIVVPQVVKKSKKIITVSDYEKGRIESVFGLDNVVTVYNSYSEYFTNHADFSKVTSAYINSPKYIFAFGNTDPKKNTTRVLVAYAEYLKGSEQKLPLLLADINNEQVLKILEDNKISWILPYIKLTGYIKNSDLPYIYSGAEMFLYVSLRESFGIPLLESMACGTPVISSNTSAIPEITNDAALLVDPFNISDIANALLKIENDHSYRRKLINKGLERVEKFSWLSTAKRVLDIYKKTF